MPRACSAYICAPRYDHASAPSDQPLVYRVRIFLHHVTNVHLLLLFFIAALSAFSARASLPTNLVHRKCSGKLQTPAPCVPGKLLAIEKVLAPAPVSEYQIHSWAFGGSGGQPWSGPCKHGGAINNIPAASFAMCCTIARIGAIPVPMPKITALF